MSWEIVPEHEGIRRTRDGSFPWWIPCAVGGLVVAAGLGLLIWPFIAASWLLVVLFGSALIANGLAMLVRARGSAAAMVGGALLVVAGALSIVFSDFTVSALVTFAGVALIVIGAFWLILSASFGARSWQLMLPSVLTILAGVVALAWPGVALVFVAVVSGLLTLLIGSLLIWSSLALRGMSA